MRSEPSSDLPDLSQVFEVEDIFIFWTGITFLLPGNEDIKTNLI